MGKKRKSQRQKFLGETRQIVPRYGYRRLRIFLRRSGYALGEHRAHRLWSQAGLQCGSQAGNHGGA